MAGRIVGAAMAILAIVGAGAVGLTAAPARAETSAALPPESQLLMAPTEMTAPVQPSVFDLLAAMDDDPPAAPVPAMLTPGVRRHGGPLTALVEIGDVALIGLVATFGVRTRSGRARQLSPARPR